MELRISLWMSKILYFNAVQFKSSYRSSLNNDLMMILILK